MPGDNKPTVREVDMDANEDPSLLDRVRRARETVQRKETATRAKRRASARRVEKSEPETVAETAKVAADEVSGLVDDAGDLVTTKVGGTGDGGGISEALGSFGEGFDAEALDEPLMESESGDNEIADPVGATMAADPEMTDEMSNDPDDEILDPADADPLSVDEGDDLDELL
jgi:hypothetical protein